MENLASIDPESNFFDSFTDLCSYFTVQEYNDLNSDVYNFCLFNYNVRSFAKNGDGFKSLLGTFKNTPEVITLTETWVNESTISLCSIDSYDSHHTFRPGSNARGGGVSIFCSNKYQSEKIQQLSFCLPAIEVCTVKLFFGGCRIFIVGVYRPPNANVEDFNSLLNEILQSSLLRNSYLTMLTGDMNINLCREEELQSDANYVSILKSLFYLPTITKPTRFNSSDVNFRPSNLDHIWINQTHNFRSGIINFDLTDHCPCFINLKITHAENFSDQKIKIQFRPFSQDSLDKLFLDVLKVNWDELLPGNDVSADALIFIQTLDRLYCSNFPLKTKYVTEKHFSKPWVSSTVKCLISEKSKIFKEYKLGVVSREYNNRHRNIINRKIRDEKIAYYSRMFNRYTNDMKKSWKLINELTCKKPKSTSVNSLIVDGTEYNREGEVAEKFNDFFGSIAERLDNLLPASNLSPLEFLSNSINQSLFLSPVSEQECQNLISNLKNTKTELNCLLVKVFKSISCLITYPLAKIINNSFISGTFPDCLKTARITPIFKSGEKTDPGNFRPIVSIPFISKIIEKSLNSRLVNFFDKNSLFTDVQSGFRKGKSTFDALLKLVNEIYDSLNSRNFMMSIFVDLKKAFDTVSHPILIGKLERYGVRGTPLNLIRSFLSNRKQFVKIGNSSSRTISNRLGVPQGSNLGPTLFLIYINDAPNCTDLLKTLLFADDSVHYHSNNSFSTLIQTCNNELDKIQQWCISNRLSINVSKCNNMLFTNRKTDITINSSVGIGQEVLETVSIFKYLGIFIDENLTFAAHIKHVTSKLSMSNGILYKIRDFLPREARLRYYNCFIYPYLNYNIEIWGGTYSCHLERLVVQQKRIIRTL